MNTIDIIYESIDEHNSMQSGDSRLEKDPKTELFGGKSNLDSLGLVTFIVNVEQRINNNFKKVIALADERAMSQKRSPFRNVQSLVDYIDELIKD